MATVYVPNAVGHM